MRAGRRPTRLATLVALESMAALVCSLLPATARADEPTYEVAVAPDRLTFSPGAGAAVGSTAALWSTGAASTYVTTTERVRRLSFEVVSQPCEGAPHLEVAVDGVTVVSQEVYGGRAYPSDFGSDYGVPLDWAPGRHQVVFRFTNDRRTATCDRNLRIGRIGLSGRPDVLTQQDVQASTIEVDPTSAGETGGPGRSWRGQVKLWNDGTARFRLDSQRSVTFLVFLRAVRCAGWTAHLRVTLDGRRVYDGQLPHAYGSAGEVSYGYLRVDDAYADGPHDVAITMSKDLRTPTCDRSVTVGDAYFRSLVPDGLP